MLSDIRNCHLTRVCSWWEVWWVWSQRSDLPTGLQHKQHLLCRGVGKDVFILHCVYKIYRRRPTQVCVYESGLRLILGRYISPSSCSPTVCTRNERHSLSHPALLSTTLSLYLIWLSIHASLPWVPGHLGHGENQEGNTSEEEENKGGAGTSKGPGVVVFDPYCVLALNHSFDWLTHHFQWDEGAETWEGEICVKIKYRNKLPWSNCRLCWLTKPTCKCKEHARRFEEVFSSFSFSGTRSQQTERPQEHEGQTEDGDGRGGDVVLCRKGNHEVKYLLNILRSSWCC